MKVAIAGTGGLAQHIAHAARSRGHEVLLLSRNAHPELAPLPVLTVDYSSPSSLLQALTGMETLISTATHPPAQLALIDACLSARVRRFAPAEFEGPPDCRPLACTRAAAGRLDVLHRLREEKHRLDSTVFVCGLLMERFGPGGLAGSGAASGSGVLKGEGTFLVDFRAAKAWIPEGDDGVKARFCAVGDVARFVAAALEAEVWPEQWRCWAGERLGVRGVVRIAEKVRGRRFEVVQNSWEELHDLQLEKEEKGEWEEVARIEMLLAAQRAEFDFVADPVGEGEVETWTTFEMWLRKAWEGVELD